MFPGSAGAGGTPREDWRGWGYGPGGHAWSCRVCSGEGVAGDWASPIRGRGEAGERSPVAGSIGGTATCLGSAQVSHSAPQPWASGQEVGLVRGSSGQGALLSQAAGNPPTGHQLWACPWGSCFGQVGRMR